MNGNKEKQERTKKRLQESLIALCGERNYYSITIGDICSKANVYRSTFYRYYDSKDEMLREIEQKYIEDTRNLTTTVGKFRLDCTKDELAQYKKELAQDMEYHRRHRQLSKFLLSPNGDPYFAKSMRESLTRTFQESIRSKTTAPWQYQSYATHFFVNGFISTIFEWLKNDDRTPEEIADFLLSMLTLFAT